MKDCGSKEVSVRRIDNGFVRRESRYGDGDYSSRETFSKDHPGFDDSPKAARATVSDSSLKGAFDHLKKGK